MGGHTGGKPKEVERRLSPSSSMWWKRDDVVVDLSKSKAKGMVSFDLFLQRQVASLPESRTSPALRYKVG